VPNEHQEVRTIEIRKIRKQGTQEGWNNRKEELRKRIDFKDELWKIGKAEEKKHQHKDTYQSCTTEGCTTRERKGERRGRQHPEVGRRPEKQAEQHPAVGREGCGTEAAAAAAFHRLVQQT
jgi:hypothetical protein